jgi:threonine synthase
MTPRLRLLRCPRCGHISDGKDRMAFKGCPACARGGHAVALVCDPPRVELAPSDGFGRGIWRWSAALPVDRRHAVSLGEGDTPLLRLPRVARDVGVGNLYVKNEAANPTGSHKDRLAAIAVSAARQIGAGVITGASTGNHGAALAAYSAQADLRCVIFTTPMIPDPMRAAIEVTGAELVMAPDADARYGLMIEAVERDGWLVCTNGTSPPVGSPPFAVEGYRTIAYEIYEQLGGRAPDWVVIPVSYGDCLAGVQRGFAHLAETGQIPRAPRLAAVEPHGALERALVTGTEIQDPVPLPPTTPAFSLAVRFTTDQAVRALNAADGVAVTVPEDELLREQHRLGRLSGLYAEVSSSITIAAARRLVIDGTISADASVVCLLTATGLKDPATTLNSLPSTLGRSSSA